MDVSYGPLLTRQMELRSKIPADILVGSKIIDLDPMRVSGASCFYFLSYIKAFI
jgi:hypothetical protein